jgi:hypothetical protein
LTPLLLLKHKLPYNHAAKDAVVVPDRSSSLSSMTKEKTVKERVMMMAVLADPLLKQAMVAARKAYRPEAVMEMAQVWVKMVSAKVTALEPELVKMVLVSEEMVKMVKVKVTVRDSEVKKVVTEPELEPELEAEAAKELVEKVEKELVTVWVSMMVKVAKKVTAMDQEPEPEPEAKMASERKEMVPTQMVLVKKQVLLLRISVVSLICLARRPREVIKMMVLKISVLARILSSAGVKMVKMVSDLLMLGKTA